MNDDVTRTIEDGICTITFSNQGKRNALSPTILEGLVTEIEAIANDNSIRVLILTGQGDKAFSSGYDITEFEESGAADTGASFEDAISSVQNFSFPTIAMINGDTYGGAIELAAVCDIRIAVRDARFGITPAKLGVIYGDNGIKHVMDLIGPAHTKELLFTGESITAPRAAEIGFVNHCVDRQTLKPKTYSMAQTIAGNAPKSLAGMKQIIQSLSAKQSFNDTEKAWVDRIRADAFQSEDHKEGVAAFAEGRSPEFTGT